MLPFTVIFAEDEVVTGEYLQDAIARYVAGDDVFSEDFLEGLYIAHNGTSSSSSSSRPSLDASALEYLTSTIKPRYLFLDSSFNESCGKLFAAPTYLKGRMFPKFIPN